VADKKKGIPVEVLELPDPVLVFQWEPKGTRMAVVHGDSGRYHVSFYLISNKIKEIKTLAEKMCNRLFWSPKGGVIILAGLGTMNGVLEFYDVNNLDSCAINEHFMCTDVNWDSSGRYVISSVTQPFSRGESFFKQSMENGYRLWSMHGHQLARKNVDTLYQVLWRPRPPPLLTQEEIKEIRKNLKQRYAEKFSKEDEEIENLNLSEEARLKKDMEQMWKKYREERIKEWEKEAPQRSELFPGMEDEELVDVEEFEEEILSTEEEIVDRR